MSSPHVITKVVLATLLLLASLPGIPHSETTDSPVELVFTVPNVTSRLGQTGQYLDIRLSNYFDTVAGYDFTLTVSNPELVTFDFDSLGFDTAGTLTSGFELVHAVDESSGHTMIRMVALADLPFGEITPGFSPQEDGILLRIPFKTASRPDYYHEMRCEIRFSGFAFSFSDPSAHQIGSVVDTSYDTTWYKCTTWQSDTCLEWTQNTLPIPDFDSLSVDTLSYTRIDWTRVVRVPGSVTFELDTCDNDNSGTVNVVDLTCLVHYLFGGPGSGCPFIYCDWDGSGSTNIVDLLQLVEYLFGGDE